MLQFSPQRLDADFGCSSELAQWGIQALHQAIAAGGRARDMPSTGDEPPGQGVRLAAFRSGGNSGQAGQVLRSDRPQIQSGSDPVRRAELLRAHSETSCRRYCRFHPPAAAAVARDGAGGNGRNLRRQLEDIEQRRLLRQQNVEGFSDGGLFAWYTSAWCEPVERLAHSLAAASGGTKWTLRPRRQARPATSSMPFTAAFFRAVCAARSASSIRPIGLPRTFSTNWG